MTHSHCVWCGDSSNAGPCTEADGIHEYNEPVYRLIQHEKKESFRGGQILELSRFLSGTNTAASIRRPTATSENLTIDDVQFYIHNRRRVLSGLKAHTPEEWFQAVR